MTKLLIQIPFVGFYETLYADYDRNLYDDLELSEEEMEEYGITEEKINEQIDSIDHKKTQEAIAEEYAYQFSDYYDVKVTFESLDSPKEYNFTSDRIFCHIDLLEMRRIFNACEVSTLTKYIKERFTSRDGFSSFYSGNIEDWDFSDFTKLDHNELSVILEAWLETEHGETDLSYDLYDACLIHEKIVYQAAKAA